MPSPVGDLNLLRAFLAVADARSFTAAAERLHIARPQVSLQIRRLENVLGAALFHRTTRGYAHRCRATVVRRKRASHAGA